MAFKVRAVPAFDRSLAAALDFLDETDTSGKAALRLLSELKVVKKYLSAFPCMYAIREDESRAFGGAVCAARVGKFLAYYVVDENADEVVFYVLRHALADLDSVDWAGIAGS